MARYTGPSCRLCRRENMELFLKGERCYTDKCAIKRRNYPPGQHGQGRPKVSNYGVQLREKQKVRRIYGILEKQFRSYFQEADRLKGVTGENLLSLLERRLDNVVYRLGFAASRTEARILVRHNHFTLNGKKANIPSIQLRAGDVVELKEKSRKIACINESLDAVVRRGIPQWLELEKDAYKGVVKTLPVREDITMPIQEQLIVELYSK
ncbi:30S ribosomal protein S4 [Geobacter sulfurreducens]|uniref:Small ribosomal subunit protein uS4 n=1 Tax=Geobacter sulfurreducens (strain ATCC 51573 / DSM 12127 / PCA) TaxID=243231 RepID=RS4_GEOSL|nr:30S ribosomal protein S4 [Geobacter sulfurreducens]Q749B2.1 RecName: Full=Small ribosomal subunit protein uS4; AltName: Full=30S ribosomal protein S4 [Geobacter sulfurreducens PCA]AAR36225.1 ribosomal protein S4 [Geobacter sulfurreducens PCA]ADI85585.2 ribosomal protein S4 [Geobacter sulfurreducens KN400]AJY69100.1 30S ribosomal protein S4 [Geobacter sulfurreducens]QVW34647.1 30S ribosomal protein S4 [Geobacter sulfurreducens]UAC03516.1 30S ribosomal protein S4 [Geobacter sulfurreducens]